MTDKNIKHGKRNSDYWDRLIERYYSGNTTIDEEKELSRFVFSESQNKRYDEIRAVLSYSLIGNSIKGKIRSRQQYVVIDNNLIAKIQVSPSDFLLNLKKQDETVQLPEQDIPISLSPC